MKFLMYSKADFTPQRPRKMSVFQSLMVDLTWSYLNFTEIRHLKKNLVRLKYILTPQERQKVPSGPKKDRTGKQVKRMKS